jgi:hypothetical protein
MKTKRPVAVTHKVEHQPSRCKTLNSKLSILHHQKAAEYNTGWTWNTAENKLDTPYVQPRDARTHHGPSK